jgi:TetR/AcrR family transcriptional regulator
MARDGQHTAERILQTAHQLFMERGYVGVSINDVVQAAGITKPTLYYHFADKEALYAAVAEHALQLMGQELRAEVSNTDGTFVQRLTRLIEIIQGHRDEDFRMMRHQVRTFLSAQRQKTLATAFHEHMVTPIVSLMTQGQKSGDIPAGSATELAMMLLCHIEAYIGPEVQAMRLHMNAERIALLFLYGIHTPVPAVQTHEE